MQPPVTFHYLGAAQSFFISPTLISTISEIFCDKPMKYLAQIQWDTLMDGTEGTLYIEFCPDCQIVSMQHQQT